MPGVEGTSGSRSQSLGTPARLGHRVGTALTVAVPTLMTMTMLTGDSAELRKDRRAFFTPPALCDYVVD